MKRIIGISLLLLSPIINVLAGNHNWTIGYIGNGSYSIVSGLDELNNLLTKNNLPVLSNKLAITSDDGFFASSNKWIFSFSRFRLNNNSKTEFNGYVSDFRGNGNVIKIGYNFLNKKKSDLYLSFGGGLVNIDGKIRTVNSKNIENTELFSFRNNDIEIEQNNMFYLIELMFLYPIFTDIFNCSDLFIGVNGSYRYTIEQNATLNNSAVDLGNTNFSGFSAGISLKWAFDIDKIVNEK
jgi:hypothetical protein